ncbi:hypothetical protein GCM10022206_06920 [Streptomyces chiangmaiensis]
MDHSPRADIHSPGISDRSICSHLRGGKWVTHHLLHAHKRGGAERRKAQVDAEDSEGEGPGRDERRRMPRRRRARLKAAASTRSKRGADCSRGRSRARSGSIDRRPHLASGAIHERGLARHDAADPMEEAVPRGKVSSPATSR